MIKYTSQKVGKEDNMSLGIAFKGAEGVVLAADSRVTLTAETHPNPKTKQLLPAYYDNATKLLSVDGQKFIGAVTYGVGAVGKTSPRTAHSYIPEFEAELLKANTERLKVEEFANRLGDFFMRQWITANMPTNDKNTQMIFLVGGYDEGSPYGRVFELFIPSKPKPREWHKGDDKFGIVWGGQREYTDRLINGFDERLPDIAQQVLGLTRDKTQLLKSELKKQLQASIPYPFLPLQDCVDISVLLIRTTIAIQNWIVGIRGVGGPIDVATITRVEGFQSIQRKAIMGERFTHGI